MPSSPKIIVLKSREIVYTVILVFLAVLLILCMVLMFTGPKTSSSKTQKKASVIEITEADSSVQYIPGIYTSAISLGGNSVNVEVTVDKSCITGIQLTNLSTAVTASFPLITPAFDHLREQILAAQSLQSITCSQENRYTSQLLFSAIEKALKHAYRSDPS